MKNILFGAWNSEHLIKHGVQIKPFQSLMNLNFKNADTYVGTI